MKKKNKTKPNQTHNTCEFNAENYAHNRITWLLVQLQNNVSKKS